MIENFTSRRDLRAIKWLTALATIAALISALLLSVASGPGTSKASAAGSDTAGALSTSSSPIIGSWKVKVSVDGVPAPAFTSLESFHPGGIVTETRHVFLPSPMESVPSLLQSPGHGTWQKTGPNRYEAYFEFVVQLPPPSGTELGTDNVRMHLTLKGDQLSGTFESEITVDNAGTQAPFTGTMKGVRITA